MSVEILPTATQQCRNYLYDKSWTNRSYEVGGLQWLMCSKHVHSTMMQSSRFHCLIGVINKPTTHLYTYDFLWRNFLSPQCTNCSRDTCDPCTKFEVSSVSRYGDITSGVKFWPLPFQGIFFIGRVGLAMVNQCTKFEVSRFTRYKAMNGSAKCRKWGGLGQLGVTHGQPQCHHSIERIRLPIRF